MSLELVEFRNLLISLSTAVLNITLHLELSIRQNIMSVCLIPFLCSILSLIPSISVIL